MYALEDSVLLGRRKAPSNDLLNCHVYINFVIINDCGILSHCVLFFPVQETLCKEQHLALPKVPPNGATHHSLSNGEPPRVPPLPNELIASEHMTSSVPPCSTGVRRKWNQSGTRQEAERAGQAKPKQLDQAPKAMDMLISLDPANYDILTVKEPMKAGMSKALAEQVKECEIDLERIDQELLELGPFAKDTCLPLKEEMSPVVGMPGMGLVPQLTSPSTLPHQQQQPSSRKSRKGVRQPYAGSITNKAGMAKRRSETGSASSPSLSDEREPLPPMVDRMLHTDSEAVKDAPAKSKWRKVGSSGSPVTHSPISNLSSKRVPGSYDANSPISESRTPPSHSQPVPLPSSSSAKTKAREKIDADIDSPSMIPAASEIEMLSLYMPNSHWETIESSPLRTPEHYSPEMGRTPQPAAMGGAESTKNHDQSLGPDPGRKRDRTPLRTNSSYSAESTSNERTGEVEHHLPAVSAPNSAPSPLTTSIARHSNKPTINPPVSSHLPVSSGHSSQGGGPTSGGDVRRHIVVKDGASVSHTSSYQQNTSALYPPHVARENRSATPGERGDVTSPAALGHVPPHSSASLPPQMTPDVNHHPTSFMRHRRSSSSSSLRSMKPLDDRKQPTLPSHQRLSSSSSPLQQQHHMQMLGGKAPR